jgi:hypothetical protein
VLRTNSNSGAAVYRGVYDICESSYKNMGGNLGGGEQRATGWYIH